MEGDSASFLRDRPFVGQAKPVVNFLKDSAQDFSIQKNIKAMFLDSPSQEKPPSQGAGTFQVPQIRKLPSKGTSPPRPHDMGPRPSNNSAQPKQAASMPTRSLSAKPPKRETHSTKWNLFKGGSCSGPSSSVSPSGRETSSVPTSLGSSGCPFLDCLHLPGGLSSGVQEVTPSLNPCTSDNFFSRPKEDGDHPGTV